MRRVNSSGMMYFVDGLAPSLASASRYCSDIVFWSTSRAAPKICASAWLKPSARRIADWRSPSARRICDCLSPSATLIVAWRVPSDSVMTARRVRSARELPVHRVLDVARRRDLADLDRRHLAAPALGHLVELGAQDLVDLLAS